MDEILAELGQLLALAKRAAEASGEDANLSSLQDILPSAQEIRLGKVEDARRDVKEYTDLVKSIGLAVGAGLLAVSLVGLAGAALLVRCLLCRLRCCCAAALCLFAVLRPCGSVTSATCSTRHARKAAKLAVLVSGTGRAAALAVLAHLHRYSTQHTDAAVPARVQQNWIQAIFLFIAAAITWAGWVLFGIFATVNLVIVDFCQNIDDNLQQRPGAQVFLSCPDLAAAQASIQQVFIDINRAVATANLQIDGALVRAFAMVPNADL